MKLYDFDGAFQKHLTKWMTESAGKFRNMDEMEAAAPDEYLRWINEPAEFLDGEKPGLFFAKFDDPEMLVDWMAQYEKKKGGAPDLLMERISDLGTSAIPQLVKLANDTDACVSARVAAINLLKEIDDPSPAKDLLAIILHRRENDELADTCAEFLVDRGSAVIGDMIDAYPKANRYAKDTLLDILCNFPGDERIYTFAIEAFEREPDRRAMNASYLEKLGDPRAVEKLTEAAKLADINYLDFLEIKNAIEALGGEIDIRREFAGDPYYESLRHME